MSLVVILADDFTGAADALAPFVAGGARTCLQLEPLGVPGDVDVVGIDLDCRTAPARVTAERVKAGVGAFPGARFMMKLDSTLRGDPRAQLDALRAALPERVVLVAPAYPRFGRLQRDGVLYVEGVPVAETDFGRDLFAPCRSSRLADALPGANSAVVASADGVETVAAAGARAIGVDVATDAELAALAPFARDERFVFAGSAALAATLAPVLLEDVVRSGKPIRAAERGSATGPVLFAIGSVSAMTHAQIAHFADARGAVERVDPRAILIDEGRRAREVTDRVAAWLGAGRDVLVALSAERDDVAAALSLGRAHGFDIATTGRELRERFVALVAPAVASAGTVVVSGADVARSFCEALGVRALRGERLVSSGLTVNVTFDGSLRIVAKGGGHGEAGLYGELARELRWSGTVSPQA